MRESSLIAPFAMLFAMILILGFLVGGALDKRDKRIERLEKIVGTEAPASMTWTNGHIYSTIVKHSHNCGCVKK